MCVCVCVCVCVYTSQRFTWRREAPLALPELQIIKINYTIILHIINYMYKYHVVARRQIRVEHVGGVDDGLGREQAQALDPLTT
jgi:hypothetical protein